jgi:hypothetical protein
MTRRGVCRFKKSDVRRAVEAVQAAGQDVARVEIDPSGKVVIVIGTPDDGGGNRNRNEWDEEYGADQAKVR